jgi:hypothetical protein
VHNKINTKIAEYSAQFSENGGSKQLEYLVRSMVQINPQHG